MTPPKESIEQSLAPLRELFAIAQNGLTFASDPFDRERYMRLREIVLQMMSGSAPATPGLDANLLLPLEPGYATPKIDVRGAAFRDGRILLVRERSDGLWTLPGGWADVNLSPSEAIVKEIREESGFEARATRLAAVFDRRQHPHPPSFFYVYKMFFLCELTGGSAASSVETDGVDFFAEDALPPLSIQRVTAKQIAAMFRHEREKHLPAEFD